MTEKDFLLQDEAYARLVAWAERLPHAILLHGPRGVGKLQLAEHFARRMLCESRSTDIQPCGRCNCCNWFLAGNHPDFRLVEPESMARTSASEEGAEEEGGSGGTKRKPSIEIRIEQIRELNDFVHMGSHRGGRRIALIHPAEDMNVPTANALLKNLEEPPPQVVFVLVSHRPARLLPTIRSRCVQVPVAVPGRARASRWLESQGVKDAASWLAFAGGAPLLAIQFAQSELGEKLAAWLRAVERNTPDAIEPGSDREALEPLVDLLQKHALDRALLGFGQASKYGGRLMTGPGPKTHPMPIEWLRYARELGRRRLLARHPLNPRLFAADLLGTYPGVER